MGRKVLVIEDNADIAHLLQVNLRDIACDVQVANDGQQGLRMALEQDFDLIILDMNLPGNEDVRLLEFIRMNKPAIPIIIFSTLTAKDEVKHFKDLGVRDVITKPIQKEQVLKMLNKHIRRKKSQ